MIAASREERSHYHFLGVFFLSEFSQQLQNAALAYINVLQQLHFGRLLFSSTECVEKNAS